VDDPKFANVYDDDAALATWLRLLIGADAMWPAPAHLPRKVKSRALDVLVKAGLVDLTTGDRYRIHGLEAERTRRSETGRNAAAVRWQSERNAVSNAKPMLDETRRDKTSQDEQSNWDGREDLETFVQLKHRIPTHRQRALLDDVLDRHDVSGPGWAAGIMRANPSDPIGAVIEADKTYRAERIAAANEAEKPKPKPRRAMGTPTSTRDLLNDWVASGKEPAA
jgi:hypothetical protein